MRQALLGLLLWMVAGLALAQAGDKLGVGDAVRVTVFQQPDLTLETRVDEKGMISMPLVGQVKVAGLTTAAAGTQIGEALKRGKFLNNPQVNVALTTLRSRQVSVLGQVARPGAIRWTRRARSSPTWSPPPAACCPPAPRS